MADPEKGWFSNDMNPPPDADKHKLRKMYYASYNRGVSGIIYLLAQAKHAQLEVGNALPFVEKGLQLIRERYINRIENTSTGLHFGSDGIAAVLASAIQRGLITGTSEHLEWIGQLLEKSNQSWNMLRGMAGQGMANLVSKPFISPQQSEERLRSYAELLIAKQDPTGCWVNNYYRQKYTRRKLKKVAPGFAEGMAGIIYFLLEYGYGHQHATSIQAARKGLLWLVKKAKRNTGTVHWVSAKNKELDYGWANGTAGIALTFIRAFQYTGEDVYRQYATRALCRISPEIMDNNIGQRSGLSGLGEVYLEAYKILKDYVWIERAGWIAQVIMQLKKEHPQYGVYWLVEDERRPVANFMIGNSGVLHFLLRYCYPDKLGAPLLFA